MLKKITLPSKENLKKYGIVFAIEFAVVAVLVALDLITKEFIYGPLAKSGTDNVIIEGFLVFSPHENTGAAFSVFSGNALILAFVSLFASVAVIVLQIWSIKWRNPCLRAGIVLILAGAIGNMIDRFALGYVRDFVDLKGIFNWVGVFNFADSCITVGAVVVIVYLIFFYNKDLKKFEDAKKSATDATSEPILETERAEQIENAEQEGVSASNTDGTIVVEEPAAEIAEEDGNENA